MSGKKREQYTIDNFPDHLLRPGGRGDKESSKDSYGSFHQYSSVEVSPGDFRKYLVMLPALYCDSMNYWLDVDGNNLRHPSIYLHPRLHEHWSDRGPDGLVSKTRSEDGTRVEKFCERIERAWSEGCRRMKPEDRSWMMGTSFKDVNEKTVFCKPMVAHPKYPDDHMNAGDPDTDKSPCINFSLWTKDPSKESNDDKTKKKQFVHPLRPTGTTLGNPAPLSELVKRRWNDREVNKTWSADDALATPLTDRALALSSSPEKPDDSVIVIPDTDLVILTSIYIKIPARTTRRDSQGNPLVVTTSADQVPAVKLYDEIRKFMYRSVYHPNTSTTRGEMLIIPFIIDITGYWDSKCRGQPCQLKMRLGKLIIGGFVPRLRSLSLKSDEVSQMNDLFDKARNERGIDWREAEEREAEEEDARRLLTQGSQNDNRFTPGVKSDPPRGFEAQLLASIEELQRGIAQLKNSYDELLVEIGDREEDLGQAAHEKTRQSVQNEIDLLHLQKQSLETRLENKNEELFGLEQHLATFRENKKKLEDID